MNNLLKMAIITLSCGLILLLISCNKSKDDEISNVQSRLKVEDNITFQNDDTIRETIRCVELEIKIDSKDKDLVTNCSVAFTKYGYDTLPLPRNSNLWKKVENGAIKMKILSTNTDSFIYIKNENGLYTSYLLKNGIKKDMTIIFVFENCKDCI